MGYPIIIINLKENSILLWNKKSLLSQSPSSPTLLPKAVTVASFLQSFQRYPTQDKSGEGECRVRMESVCVHGWVGVQR